jgi:hypothetical protein
MQWYLLHLAVGPFDFLTAKFHVLAVELGTRLCIFKVEKMVRYRGTRHVGT